ncbi:MAG: four helix bundle protein [Caldilineales bacterium]|nr:four helix bundle protein [Caldilineales bacterium]
MAKGDDIEERMINFAVAIVKLCDKLPNSFAGRHIASQLLRSGTAPAPHYAEARGAESKRDFIHKLGICVKELNESQVWLDILYRSQMLPSGELEWVRNECDQISRIVSASIRTAKSRE